MPYGISQTCHPTEMRIPALLPAEAEQILNLATPGRMHDSVDLCYLKADRPGIEPRHVSCKSNALPLSHHATQIPPREGTLLAGGRRCDLRIDHGE